MRLHLWSQGQAQECLLEKSMLDNRKSFLVARISAQVGMGETVALEGPRAGLWFTADAPLTTPPGSQVVDYYKEACRALENPDTASLLGRIQKDWKKLVQMKIYYFAAVAHVRALRPRRWAGLGWAAAAWEVSSDHSSLSQLHMGKQAEEQQKFGEQVSDLW